VIRTSTVTDDGEAPLEDQVARWPQLGTGLRGRVAGGQGESPHPLSGEAAPAEGSEDPISPELVLIDPKLRQRARELLPAHGPWSPQPTGSAADGTVEQAAAAVDVAALRAAVSTAAPALDAWPAPEPAGPPSRAGRRRWVRAVSSVLVVGVLAALGWTLFRGQDAERDAQVDVGAAAPSSVPAPATPAGGEAKAPRAPAGPRTMAFGWVPVRNARVYLVEFFKGPQKIFEAQTGRTRLTVPAHWSYEGRRHSLAPGRYRWTVRPGLGAPAIGRFGQPVVRASLVVRSNAN
jgi:hypothetical protein